MLLRAARPHRLNRGGDRQLNHALHIIAIIAANVTPPPESLARKEAEGKTKKGALRCLKHHLARASTTSSPKHPRQQQAADCKPIVESACRSPRAFLP